MPAHNSKRRRQTQAPAEELGREERIEDARSRPGIHAAPGICHADADVIPASYPIRGEEVEPDRLLVHVPDSGPDRHRTRVFADRLRAVQYQVHEELTQL